MAKLYARRCENNGMNFYEIPSKWQTSTRVIIVNDGYIILEDGTVVKE